MISIKKNSFDIISLIAAINVMAAHIISHSSSGGGGSLWFWRFIAPGPAVAVMFAVSGFLVTASYERSDTISVFYSKRILRIYPPLIVVVVVPAVIYYCMGLLPDRPIQILVECIKTICIGSFGSFTVPEGAVGNGSLWTIFIQMQFYILTPILYRIAKNRKAAMVLFMGLLVENLISLQIEQGIHGIFGRIYSLLCLPYLYMYFFGMVIYMYRDLVLNRLEKALVPLSICYVLVHWVFAIDLRFQWKYINPLSALLIMGIAIGFAFRLGNHRMTIDLSYGIYLWHLVIFDFIHVVFGMDYSVQFVLLVWTITITVAALFNIWVERPLLRYFIRSKK